MISWALKTLVTSRRTFLPDLDGMGLVTAVQLLLFI
jgi:hypothetical protein